MMRTDARDARHVLMNPGAAGCPRLPHSASSRVSPVRHQTPRKKENQTVAKQKTVDTPADIEVVVLKETPERVIDKMRARRYPRGWVGALPADLATAWKAKGFVKFKGDDDAPNPPPGAEDGEKTDPAKEEAGKGKAPSKDGDTKEPAGA